MTLFSRLLPGLILVCLYGLNAAFLQCHAVFFVPSLAPCLMNMSWIIGSFYLKDRDPSEALFLLTFWVVGGFVLQWLVTLPFVFTHLKGQIKGWFSWHFDPEIKALLHALGLGILGVAAMQINSCIDGIFARFADLRAPVYLWHSIRLQQLALALFGFSGIYTLTPFLSRTIQQGDIAQGKEVFQFGAKRLIGLMVLPTLAILCLGKEAIDLIYMRGAFSSYAALQTTRCLYAYSLGLFPAALVVLQSSLLYAIGQFRIPSLSALITVLFNICLNALLIFGFQWGAISTSCTTSLGALCNCFFLQRYLNKQGWHLGYTLFLFRDVIIAGGLAYLIARGVGLLCSHTPLFSAIFLNRLIAFIFPALAFICTLIVYSFLFKSQSILEVFDLFFKRHKTLSEESNLTHLQKDSHLI